MLGFVFITNTQANTKQTIPDKLIFAVQPSYLDSVGANGLKDNIVIKLAKQLNIKVELYPCPWARCLKLIESGKADIIDDLFFTKDRALYLEYLQPSFETQTAGFRFYSLTHKIRTFDDLNNLRVAYLRGYKHFPKFDDSQKFDKVSLLNLKDMVNMMFASRLDVFIAAPSFQENEISAYDPQQLIKKQEYAHIQDMPLYLGISKKSTWFVHKTILENGITKIVKYGE